MTIRPGLFVLLVLATAAVMAALRLVDEPLREAEIAPEGIVSFQFAGNVPRAQAMLDLWARRGVLPQAAFSLGLDFLLPVLYATVLAFACFWTAVQLRPRSLLLDRIAQFLASCQWLAAALDMVENTTQIIMVFRRLATAPWPELAWWCAVSKFALLGAGLCCATAGVLVRLMDRLR